MTTKKKAVRKGAAKLRKKLGYRSSQLWFLPWQMDLIKEAANLERRPVTVFTILATVAAARKVIEKKK